MPRKGEKVTPESKAKMQETRARLGPRLGQAPYGGHRVTAPSKAPRATGTPKGLAGSHETESNH